MDNCFAIKEFLPEQESGFKGIIRECRSESYSNVIRFKDIKRMQDKKKKTGLLSRLTGR